MIPPRRGSAIQEALNEADAEVEPDPEYRLN